MRSRPFLAARNTPEEDECEIRLRESGRGSRLGRRLLYGTDVFMTPDKYKSRHRRRCCPGVFILARLWWWPMVKGKDLILGPTGKRGRRARKVRLVYLPPTVAVSGL